MKTDRWALAGVLFDMDGTLIDTEPLWQAAETEMMAEFGIEWTSADQSICHGGSATRVTNYMADRVAETGQPRPEPSRFIAGFESFMVAKVRDEPLIVQPGAIGLLTEVRESGLPVALVSSSQRVLMDAVLDTLGSHWFDLTVSADDVIRHKPDPLPYEQAARNLGANPGNCVAIEDSPTGVASATAAGCFVVALDHAAPFDPAPRRKVVDSLERVTLMGLRNWVAAEPANPLG